MNFKIFLINLILFWFSYSQNNTILNLDELIDEALENNLELKALNYSIDAAKAKIPQESSFSNPELTYRLMELPDFNPNKAMWSNIELMQMLPFPGKLSSMGKVAEIELKRLQQNYNEKSVEIIMRVKSAFYELWMAQQNLKLNQTNLELMQQFLQIAQTRYAVGKTSNQDVLRTEVEIARLQKERLTYIEMEQSALAMLGFFLNKNVSEFTGTAYAPDTIIFNPDISKIQEYALRNCSKLRSDSLMIEKEKAMHQIAKLEYFPDFKFGIEYASSPMTGFRGWSLTATITLPFSPWTLTKANSRVQEAEANISKSKAMYNNERGMLLSKVREYFAKASSLKNQWDIYYKSIIPLAEQSLQVALMNYQTGQTDFLMLLDTYRMLVMEKMELIMTRKKFEQTLAELEKEIGCRDIEEIL